MYLSSVLRFRDTICRTTSPGEDILFRGEFLFFVKKNVLNYKDHVFHRQVGYMEVWTSEYQI